MRMLARRVLTACVLATCTYGLVARAQSAAPREFDVVSIKEVPPNGDISAVNDRTPGRFVTINSPLRFVLLYAYRLQDYQLIGAPQWALLTRYNITATYAADGSAPQDDVRVMVQKALADRFHISVHHERRDVPAYALVLARKDGKLGPQLAPSDVDCDQWRADKRPVIDAGGPSLAAPSGKRPACAMVTAMNFVSGGTRPISELARNLEFAAGRPVVDRTGLTGNYNIDAKWTASRLSAAGTDAPGANEAPSIFVAFEEQLGLKFESTTISVDVVVVDRLEHPTAN
jgi:uncharacterized protein (TIGR03435 family)